MKWAVADNKLNQGRAWRKEGDFFPQVVRHQEANDPQKTSFLLELVKHVSGHRFGVQQMGEPLRPTEFVKHS
jgi:hypothetical protein